MTNSDLTDTARRNQALVDAYFDALEALDVDAFGSLMTEDAIYYNPMHIGSQIFTEPKQEGRDRIVGLFRVLPDIMSKVEIKDRQYDQAIDPNKMFVRISVAFTFAKDGYVYRNDILSVFTFEDGKIASWTEFMDNVVREKAYGRPGVLDAA